VFSHSQGQSTGSGLSSAWALYPQHPCKQKRAGTEEALQCQNQPFASCLLSGTDYAQKNCSANAPYNCAQRHERKKH
jgi:hypothetical protein